MSSSASSSCRVKVAVRIRPYINRNDGADSQSIAIEAIHPSAPPALRVKHLPLEHHNTTNRERRFEFDHVLDSSASQEEVYETLGAPLLKEALNGYNCCLFSYGQTGSGKTHTTFFTPPENTTTPSTFVDTSASLQQQNQQQNLTSNSIYNGDQPDTSFGPSISSSTADVPTSSSSAGLFPRLVDDLFSQLQRLVEQDPQLTVKVTFSAVEIYMEKVRDLLAPRPSATTMTSNQQQQANSRNNSSFEPENLELFENPKTKRVQIKGLGVHNVLTPERVKELLLVAMNNRQTAPTKLNEVSSRSHSIVQLTVTQLSENPENPKDLESVITIVDLAGSERQNKSETSGQTLEEGKKINLSLLTLGRALHSLSTMSSSRKDNNSNNIEVSLRDSKLTRLLGESLGGNSKTWMLATVAASACHIQESISTLDYATHARAIANKNVHVNTSVSKEEIDALKNQLGRLEEASHSLKNNIKKTENEETKQEAYRLKHAVDAYDALAAVFHSRFNSLKYHQTDQNIAQNTIKKSIQQTHSVSGRTLIFSGSISRRKASEIEVESLDYITVNLTLDEKIRKSLAMILPSSVDQDSKQQQQLVEVSCEVTIQRLTSTQYSIHVQDLVLSIAQRILKHRIENVVDHDNDEDSRNLLVYFFERIKNIRGKVFMFQDDDCFFPMKSLSVDQANLELKSLLQKRDSSEFNAEMNSNKNMMMMTLPLSEQVGSNFSRVVEVPFLQTHQGHQFVSEFCRIQVELDCV